MKGSKTPPMAPPPVVGVTPKLAGGNTGPEIGASNIDDRKPTPVSGTVPAPNAVARPEGV